MVDSLLLPLPKTSCPHPSTQDQSSSRCVCRCLISALTFQELVLFADPPPQLLTPWLEAEEPGLDVPQQSSRAAWLISASTQVGSQPEASSPPAPGQKLGTNTVHPRPTWHLSGAGCISQEVSTCVNCFLFSLETGESCPVS